MITLKIKEHNYDGDLIADIVLDDKVVGGLEANYRPDINSFYIENIIRDKQYKGQKILSQVINYLREKYKCDIGCLPLKQYRSYYEELGFKVFMTNGEDIFYRLVYVNS